MNSRDRVCATLKHQPTDRPARDLWTLPYIPLFRADELASLLEEYPRDIDRPELAPDWRAQELDRLARPGTYADDWGSVWSVGEPGIVGEVKQPALADWASLSNYHPPWHLVRRRNLDHLNRECDRSDRFTLSPVSARPFERLQFVRGTENVFLDLAYGTPEIERLLTMIHEFYMADIASWASSNVDAVFFMDDWGTNRSLLIAPDMWRSIFKPLYRDYCEVIHAAGKYAFFHSDGHIEAIFGDLIEVGIDAINSQLFCMDIEQLGRRHKGKVTFWGEIDRQRALPFGSPDDVCAAVMRVREALDDGQGGVIAQCEWGKDNSIENVAAVFRAWAEPRDRSS